ncbi:MAG: PspA/IM30 family protein [Hyphomicrobiaceae bacterium]
MRLWSRLNHLVIANAHEALDSLENPETMAKQVLRDMDDNIREARAAVVAAVASEKQLAHQLEVHRCASTSSAGKAETALAEAREDLARAALERKVEHDQIADELERSWTSAKQNADSLKLQLETLIKRRTTANRRHLTLAARQRAARARTDLATTLSRADSIAAADGTLARCESSVEALEAESIAVSEVLTGSSGPEREISDLQIEAKVNEELEALKTRLEKSKAGHRD